MSGPHIGVKYIANLIWPRGFQDQFSSITAIFPCLRWILHICKNQMAQFWWHLKEPFVLWIVRIDGWAVSGYCGLCQLSVQYKFHWVCHPSVLHEYRPASLIHQAKFQIIVIKWILPSNKSQAAACLVIDYGGSVLRRRKSLSRVCLKGGNNPKKGRARM